MTTKDKINALEDKKDKYAARLLKIHTEEDVLRKKIGEVSLELKELYTRYKRELK